ncbi:MAG: hypothetical protein R3B06_24880 [Kofleriaceae bacterium]
MRAVAAACLGAALAACAAPPAPTCDDGVVTQALTAADRKLVGQASPYPADGMLRGRDAELAGSQQARRAAAWAAVARAVAPVPFAVTPTAADASLPRWHSWYGKDDLRRMFDHAFRTLSPDQQRARDRLDDGLLDATFAWNPTAVEELPTWPPERFAEYAAAIDRPDLVAGVGGIDRVQYSPGAARHLLASYPDILACLGQPAPPAITDAPTPGPRRMVREPVALAACSERTFGPYFVGDGESLTASLDGPGQVQVAIGTTPGAAAPACADVSCTVSGPGPVWVTAVADSEGGDATLTIDYQEADPTWAACLAGAFPLDAVIVKADWRRAQLDFRLPVFATDAAALAALRASPERAWTSSEEADPGADAIYTATLPNGNRYRLAALHLMTKELDHWLWITLWWSPDPDTDFGADRPAAIGGVWRNYKMCAVTSFTERDPDPRGGAADPTLGAALAAAHEAPAWCSNPYLEAGTHNGTSSCVGCHQHGGTTVTAEEILGDDVRFPDTGRLQVRNNFPADYSFAVLTGDGVGRMLADEVEFWTPP